MQRDRLAISQCNHGITEIIVDRVRLNGDKGRESGVPDEVDLIVRDVESGLVDFAAMRDDEAVYLCWRLGEPSIGFWHPRDTGFGGRQPLH